MNADNFPLVTAMAEKNRLQIHRDIFHGAKAIELRKQVGQEIICAGCIFGTRDHELYRRRLKKTDVFVRQYLWFLGTLFLSKAFLAGNHYQCVQRIKTSDFTEKLLVEFVAQELLM